MAKLRQRVKQHINITRYASSALFKWAGPTVRLHPPQPHPHPRPNIVAQFPFITKYPKHIVFYCIRVHKPPAKQTPPHTKTHNI